MHFQPSYRIWLVTGISLLLHVLVIGGWWYYQPPAELELVIPTSQFSVSLQTVEVTPDAQTETKTQKPQASKPTGKIIAHDKVSPVKTAKPVLLKQPVTKTPVIKTVTATTTSNHVVKKTMVTHGAQTQTSDPAVNRARIISRLHDDMRRYFYYPPLAQRKNIQGTVTLGFGISHQGAIQDIQIVKSSGFAILDLAAEDAIQRLKHVDWIQDWFSGDTIDIELPVKFKLTER